MIKVTNAYYPSDNQPNRVHAMIWADDAVTPVGVVQLAHGVCEHVGRYDAFARFLAENGFIVCGNDHLGHGKTAVSIGDLGWVEPGDHVSMVRDMHTLYTIMHKRCPDLPYIIFGHSMGSLLARVYAAHFAKDLAGAVFCGTLQIPGPALLLDEPIKRLMEHMPPAVEFGDFANRLMNKTTKAALKDDDDLAWISASRDNLAAYRADELTGFPMSNVLAGELAALAVKASLPATADALPRDFPVLFISGGKDPVGMFGAGVMAAADRYTAAGLDPEVLLYPGDRHEILNEDDREKVYADVLTFLKRCVA
ncbi:MAG: alpha/beta fold hydrolase [Clostridia bacterium]|nr:alpha/beta fold hydrolase [Clostridia bacterium]